ncbi:hypothetical protein ABZ532_24085 [Streptomyces sp. NPDC019396]|uniref:hypothetical protein n=1 Tax=Streptomyces sp. NPDC019396 TaxID=3154687 RepID=UPI0033EF9A1C
MRSSRRLGRALAAAALVGSASAIGAGTVTATPRPAVTVEECGALAASVKGRQADPGVGW